MKAYTTLEESKALVEAGLDPKTADMSWTRFRFDLDKNPHYFVSLGMTKSGDVPCWSLAALLTVLENPKIFYRLECTSGLSTELHVSGTGFSEYFEEPANAILWLLENKKL